MKQKTRTKDWLFFLTCLALAILAERSFFHGRIGVSYLVFITVFYLVFFLRFRFLFEHRRIGLLLMIGIWVMAGNYLFYDSITFYWINLGLIPVIIFFQMVLITSPAEINWSKLSFIRLVTDKFKEVINYLANYMRVRMRYLLYKRKRNRGSLFHPLLKGFLLSIPVLIVIVQLLMSADDLFQAGVHQLNFFPFKLNLFDVMVRFGIVLIIALLIFCIFKVLDKRTKRKLEIQGSTGGKVWDGIITATILILLNTVYVLFLVSEFRNFFYDVLQEGFTYAEYARKGFYELLSVTVINLTILIVFLKRVRVDKRQMRILLKVLYSFLIIMSGLLVISALVRLNLYEQEYGFTIVRLLAYTVMLFLLFILAYTLIRVWLENLPILHFYLITGFIFYVMLQVMNVEEMVVESNLERYEETGEVDIHYFNQLGAEGVKGLIALYEANPHDGELQQILYEKKENIANENKSWQGFNFAREEAKQLLYELEFDSD